MLRAAFALFCVAAVEAGKKAAAAVEMDPDVTFAAMLKDMLLFDGSFKWLFWVALCGFCAANFRLILLAKKDIRFVHGLVMGVLNSYGGSTLAAVICGQAVPFVVNEKLIVGICLTWFVVHRILGSTIFLTLIKDTSLGAVLISVCYEVMRCHVMINCHRMASNVLTAGLFAVPTIGPLIAGTLGGCGGGFFPLDKGLAPLEKDTNWRISSAFYGACWLQAMANPTVSAIVTGYVPLLADSGWVRVFAILGFVLPPLLVQSLMGMSPLGANPLIAPPTSTAKKTN